MSAHAPTRDVVVVGGCGHVGLPLAIALADQGLNVAVYDLSDSAVKLVNDGNMPFQEAGAEVALRGAIAAGRFLATTDPAVVATAESVIVVIGTPVDEHLNPDPNTLPHALSACNEYFRDGQLVVLRSTVYPGVTALIEKRLGELGLDVDVAFCPERILEGHAMVELYSLPQIIGTRTERARDRASALFGTLTSKLVHVDPEEAELAKLFTNVWRYIKFAAVNQFYMIANSQGLDFERIRTAISQDYERAADMPRAGFAAGPCLFKDTMQLGAFNDNNFALGHAAMLVNEGLPLYIVSRLEAAYDLSTMTVGILGMAFKGGSDDIRSSLSYKIKRILTFKAKRVLTSDPHVSVDPDLVPLDQVIAEADIYILATPHAEYRELKLTKPVADIWDVYGNGVVI
ncbi:MAG: nucleotide sugar dehydrogenase [Pseudonocardiales bacterium]|nr:nucleotide sugar dehydrogenase [Actinomycetota bacterium]